jgi:hypothetical protein
MLFIRDTLPSENHKVIVAQDFDAVGMIFACF